MHINQIFNSYKQQLGEELSRLINRMYSAASTQTAIRWIRLPTVALIKQCWRLFQKHICNQDSANIVDFPDDTTGIITIGIRIIIQGSLPISDACEAPSSAIELQRNIYQNIFQVLQKELCLSVNRHGLVSNAFTFNSPFPVDEMGYEDSSLYLCCRIAQSQDELDESGVDSDTLTRARVIGFEIT